MTRICECCKKKERLWRNLYIYQRWNEFWKNPTSRKFLLCSSCFSRGQVILKRKGDMLVR